jgi:hypothetical protein
MEQLTKKQERALDKMIKAVSRRFPFITGWKPSVDFLAYDTMLNIDFIIDYEKLAKFFNADTDNSWKRIIQDEGGSYPIYSLGGPFNYEKFPHIKDLSFDTSENIERILNAVNEELPEDIRITYQYENFRGELVDIPRRIRRDHYVMY